MATEIITLPGHLRVLFDQIYEGEADSGNAWAVWQRVLRARVQEPAFFRRLSCVQLACRTLRQEVATLSAGAGSITERTKNTWVGAIDELTSLTLPSDFHLAIPQWKEKARQSDITLLDTMHVFYNLHHMFAPFDPERAKSLVAELGTLAEGMKTGALEARVRAFYLRILEELQFSLANIEIFGVESAWAEGASLMGGLLRFRNELESSALLRQKAAAAAWQVMQFLGGMSAIGNGAVPIAEAAQALLGAARAV
jgi:hypothetical protein